MKVIVTGGSGKIGKAVISQLVEAGHEVFGLDRRPSERPGAKFVYVDLARRELLQPIMEQADHLIHMGEIPNSRSGHHTEEEVFGHNCTVGSLVFQLAAELKYKRVLYTSTIQVYGFMDINRKAPAALPVDETHPLVPRNVYALGKVAIENYARLCAEQQGLSVAVFRLPWVMTQDVDDDWYRWLERQEKIGHDMGIYVKDSDVAACFLLALQSERSGFDAYNLSAREALSGKPIREAIATAMPDYPALPETSGKYDSPYVSQKAQEHFGWKPSWNFLDLYRERHGRDPQ